MIEKKFNIKTVFTTHGLYITDMIPFIRNISLCKSIHIYDLRKFHDWFQELTVIVQITLLKQQFHIFDSNFVNLRVIKEIDVTSNSEWVAME